MTPRLNAPLLWSLAAIGGVVLATVLSLPGIARAALVPNVDAKTTFFEEAASLQVAYTDAETCYIDRFNGRSAFFEPKQPPKPIKRRVSGPVEPKPTPPGPIVEPEPTQPTYAGPKLTALHGDQAFFANGMLLRVGQEQDGLKLLAVEAPWTARVEHNGWEYERPLFERADDGGSFARRFDDERTEDPVARSPRPPRPAAGVEATSDTLAPADGRPAEVTGDDERRKPTSPDTAGEPTDRPATTDRPPVQSGEGTALWSDPGNRPTGRAGKIIAPEPLTEAQMDLMSHAELLRHIAALSRLQKELAHRDDEADRSLLADVKADKASLLQRLQQRQAERRQAREASAEET